MTDPKFWIEVGAFADRLMDYMATRNVPWRDDEVMREAVRECVSLIFGQARDDTRKLVEVM